MAVLDPPPSGIDFVWSQVKDWLFKLWKTVYKNLTFGGDTITYSAAIFSASAAGDGQPTIFYGPPTYLFANPGNTTIPSGVFTTIGSITLPAGRWWVTGYTEFVPNGSVTAMSAYVFGLSGGLNALIQVSFLVAPQVVFTPTTILTLTTSTVVNLGLQVNYTGGSVSTAITHIDAVPF